MEALAVSTLAVAIAEVGDKTQLLSLLLAARYRRFWPIAFGIFVATVLNHALAAWLGAAIAAQLSPRTLSLMVALSFLAVAIWTLKPDRLDDDETRPNRYGAFVTTTLAFFLAEMGDKTQIATAVLAAQYVPLVAVVAGSTLGMLIANLPVIALGARFADRLPLTAARWIAAAVFTSLALIVLLRG
jgi:putative Ca2+/H+ antiporter (TMEM165/GDT1 family)